MSAILDSRLDPERLAQLAMNDAAMETGPLRVFLVTVDKGTPFEAMGRSSSQVAMQCAGLGQRIDVVPSSRRPILRAELSALPAVYSPEVRS